MYKATRRIALPVFEFWAGSTFAIGEFFEDLAPTPDVPDSCEPVPAVSKTGPYVWDETEYRTSFGSVSVLAVLSTNPTLFEFSRRSCCLGRSERVHASLPVSLNPTKDTRTIQPHPRRDVFRAMTLLLHPNGHHPHLFQRVVIDCVAVLSQKRFAV